REGEHLPPVDEPVARDDAVARDDLRLHPEVAAAVGDELVELLEGVGIEEQHHPFARGQLARRVLPLEALGSAAPRGPALETGESVMGIRHYALPACAFSQSFRNFSRPMAVSGWLNI